MGGLVRPEDRAEKGGPHASAGKARGQGRAGQEFQTSKVLQSQRLPILSSCTQIWGKGVCFGQKNLEDQK